MCGAKSHHRRFETHHAWCEEQHQWFEMKPSIVGNEASMVQNEASMFKNKAPMSKNQTPTHGAARARIPSPSLRLCSGQALGISPLRGFVPSRFWMTNSIELLIPPREVRGQAERLHRLGILL
jgi:hypothetical protein